MNTTDLVALAKNYGLEVERCADQPGTIFTQRGPHHSQVTLCVPDVLVRAIAKEFSSADD